MSLGRLWSRVGVPLSPPHARDFHGLEHARVAQWLVRGEGFGRLAVRNIENEHAADPGLAVVGQHRSAKHENIHVLVEIVEMGLLDPLANGGAVWAVLLVDDVEHVKTP